MLRDVALLTHMPIHVFLPIISTWKQLTLFVAEASGHVAEQPLTVLVIPWTVVVDALIYASKSD